MPIQKLFSCCGFEYGWSRSSNQLRVCAGLEGDGGGVLAAEFGKLFNKISKCTLVALMASICVPLRKFYECRLVRGLAAFRLYFNASRSSVRSITAASKAAIGTYL